MEINKIIHDATSANRSKAFDKASKCSPEYSQMLNLKCIAEVTNWLTKRILNNATHAITSALN